MIVQKNFPRNYGSKYIIDNKISSTNKEDQSGLITIHLLYLTSPLSIKFISQLETRI